MQNKEDLRIRCAGDLIGAHIEGEVFDLDKADTRRGIVTATGRYVHWQTNTENVLILRTTKVTQQPSTKGRRLLVCKVKSREITLCSELDPIIFENGDIHRIVGEGDVEA